MAGNAQTDALRNRMRSLLMSPAAQKIDFFLDRLHVDGSGLSFVALALLPTPKAGHGMSIRLGHLAPNAGASYDPATNTFDFPSASYGTDAFQRAAIIHECVHALRDSHGRKLRTDIGPVTTRATSEEAAAFLAESLFTLYDTTPAGTAPSAPSWAQGTGPSSKVFAQAHTLAVKMATQTGYAVTPQDAKALRDAVLQHPTYNFLKTNPKTTYGNNGLKL